MARWTAALVSILLVSASAWAQDVNVKELYDKKCKLCHSLAGEKGKKADLGGPLDHVGVKRDEKWLRAYFANPKSVIPDAKMPKMKLSTAQWDALVAFMLSQKAPAPAAEGQ